MDASIEGIKIYKNGNKNNQSIIFVHGFPYDHTMWDKQVDFLSSKYYCVTYDVRGLGASSVGDGQYTMEKYVEDLFAIIQKLKLHKPILCGLSMGGYLSFRALEVNQNIFSRAIFCDTKAQSDTDEIKLVRAEKIKQINEKGLDAFVDAFVPVCFSDLYKSEYKEKYNAVKSLSKKNNPVGVKGALIAMLSRGDSTQFLNQIKIPTLHLCGEFDNMTPPDMMKDIASKIPNALFKVVPNSGHMSPIENHEFVNKSILEFIS
jgi:pimeloyl-ACP methyl ester carboxylesterase